MKTQTGITILAVTCVALVIAIIATKKAGSDQHVKDVDTILVFSNQWVETSGTNAELRQVNLMLTNDLAASHQSLTTLSNQFVETSTTLSNSLKTAQDQITTLTSKITDLEAQNQALDQHAAELTNTIASLSAEISQTQMKLVASETNNVFLEKELNRQVAEKAELERKFNDLKAVKTQVAKLRTDLLVQRRLAWMREGKDPAVQEKKGGQLLMQHSVSTNRPTHLPRYDLNVEVGSDGTVHVIPASANTNSPATTNAP